MSQIQQEDLAAPAAPAAPQGRGVQVVCVLEADQQLGRGLGGERLAQARLRLTGRLLALGTGRWDVEPLRGTSSLSAGLLLVDGFVARELLMHNRASVELLGPGICCARGTRTSPSSRSR
jgi:hypothetical protein